MRLAARTTHRVVVAMLSMAIWGCDAPEERPPTAAQLATREAAWRQACAARELATVSEDDISTLEASLGSIDPADPIGALSRRATEAALEFGRAFQRHAELRTRAYAQLDSAVNYATTTADSARFLERAATFTIRAPEPNTVEANVMESYVQRLNGILSDPDHRCNWDTPF
jgi:hypothetical protein